MKHQTLLLTRQDVQKILDMKRAIPIVERAFRSHGLGHTQMPVKSYLYLRKFNGDFRSMPAYLSDSHAAGFKWVNAHPDNRKFGLPAVMALVILGDAKTGYPLAVMDGTYLTAIRTGAGGGVAAKYLARKNSSVVSFIGTGAQARTQLDALRLLFRIKEIRVWSDDSQSDERFARNAGAALRGRPSIRGLAQGPAPTFAINISKSARECVRDADIIVTTTPSRKPIVKREWIARGAHINAIGADGPGKQELDPKILKYAKVVLDDWAQAMHAGEVNVPISKKQLKRSDIHASLGEVIARKKSGRTSTSEITVFDSTGLAIQDIACADFIYRQALRRHLGKSISFF